MSKASTVAWTLHAALSTFCPLTSFVSFVCFVVQAFSFLAQLCFPFLLPR